MSDVLNTNNDILDHLRAIDGPAWQDRQDPDAELPYGSGLASESKHSIAYRHIADWRPDGSDRADDWQHLYEFCESDCQRWWGIECNGDPTLIVDWPDWLESCGLPRHFGSTMDGDEGDLWLAANRFWDATMGGNSTL